VNLDREMSRYLVSDEESIRNVLQKIDDNDEGVVVCVDDAGILQGILTDGDVRRWMLGEERPDLEQSIGLIVNRNFTSARITDDVARIEAGFDQNVHIIPLTDSDGRCLAIARPRDAPFTIAGRKIGVGKPCFLIAEIGNNHNGSLDRAYKMIDAVVEAGADCVKFQMRDLTSLYSNAGDADDHREDLGSQYTLDLLTRYQLSHDDMFLALDRCLDRGVIPLVTPWDIVSMNRLEEYGILAYKTASADFTNHPFLLSLAETGKPLVCSTGMTTEAEIRDSVNLLIGEGCQFALLHCNSTYPAPFKDVNLRYMETLREIGGCPTGYSSHDRGINVSIAAAALGADIVEKHITLDKAMEGNDHRISLLPGEFAEMVAGIREVESSLGFPKARQITQGEMMNRESLAKSLIINTALAAGDIIERQMIDVQSPGRGLQPNRLIELIGKPARRSLQPGDMFLPSDVGQPVTEPRDYSFDRPVGIPVRYHDVNKLRSRSNFDFLEFHLGYKDLKEDESAYFTEPLDLDLIVHSPELFESDHLLDLSAPDDAYRRTSIDHLGRVVDLTRRLAEWFDGADRPRIVVNVGGFTQDAPLDQRECGTRYELVLDSISQLDLTGVEILPQTMPPFPWHFGGQRFHNLFVDPQEIADFCEQHNYRVCFDTSHSKLACTHHHWSFSEFVATVGPHVGHLHLGDASGVDGEGLQVLDGEIDWHMLSRELRSSAPDASFIPEIWQGHKNGGEGFWRALELLEAYF
jgi:N-acetylneuraminate synthase